MTKKLYTMTPADKIKLEEIKQKYIQNALRTDAMTDYDKEQMRIAMRGLYKDANLPYPGDDKIIFVASPLIAQVASGIAMALLHGKGNNQAADQADQADQAAGQAADQADQAARQAAGQAAGQAADQADQAARQAAGQAARQADQAARQAVGQENSLDIFVSSLIGLGKKHGIFAAFSISVSWRYRTRTAMWPWYQVYGDFFKNVAKIPGEWDKWTPLNLDALHGGVRFMTPQFTIIADRPEILKLDDEGRLHSETGAAVKWRDGMEQYYWHGVAVPDRWIKDKKSLLPEEALKTVNMDQRKAACEILGWNNILKQLKAKTIDKNKDPQIGTLIEANIPGVGKERFLKVQCGTGRTFSLIVPPTVKTAIEANAWTYNLSPGDYKPEVRT